MDKTMWVLVTQAEDHNWYSKGDVVHVYSEPNQFGILTCVGKAEHGVESCDCMPTVAPTEQPVHNKYMREVKPGVFCDVYDILRAWDVTDPCLQHLLKKALQPGKRHHKDLGEDLRDILASAKRAVEMHEEWEDKQ